MNSNTTTNNISSTASPAEHAQIPALDGLRAIAVAGVILFHIHKPILPGGFTGVDVFFVISGFLITSIILHDIHSNVFSFREFYLRRIQRLLPNAITTVVVTILLLTFFLPAGFDIFTAQHGIWNLFNLSNIYTLISAGSYWGAGAEHSFFTHFWSLGIEEQFYFIFPLMFVLLTRIFPERIRGFLIAFMLASFLLGLVSSYSRSTFMHAFYLLPMRGWELLLGSILAASGVSIYSFSKNTQRFSRTLREFLGWGGIGLIFFSYVFITPRFAFPGWVALCPALGTVFVIISIVAGESSCSRLLATTPFTAIGKVSYSLYLWHWPLITLGKKMSEYHEIPQVTGVTGAILGGVGSLFVGTAAYFLVERPLRKRGPGRGIRLKIIGFGFAGALAFCFHTAYHPRKPFPQFDVLTDVNEYYFGVPKKERMNLTKEIPVPFSITTFDIQPGKIPDVKFSKILDAGGLLHLYNGDSPRVVVWGSSHAIMYSHMIDQVCREKNLSVAFFEKNYEPAFQLVTSVYTESRKKSVREFNEHKMSQIKQWNPDVLFIIDRWDSWYKWEREDLSFVARQFDDFLEIMKPFSTKIIFVMQVPVAPHGKGVNLRALTYFLTQTNGKPPVFREPPACTTARNSMLKVVEALSKKHSNLKIIRPDLLFINPDSSLRYFDGRKFFYYDNDHLSDAGALEARPLFESVIQEMLPNKS